MKIDTFSNRFKKAIVKKGMRQIELSEKTHIPKSAINQYLSGKFEPKQDRVSIIASALEVSEAWLMGFDVPEKEEQPNLSEINEMIKIISQLSDEERKIVDGFIQGLIAKREKENIENK